MNIARAVLAAPVLAVLLAGCVDAPAPATPPAPASASATTAPGLVIDATTGVRAELPGPVTQGQQTVIGTDEEAQAVVYSADHPSGRVYVDLTISPLPAGQRHSPEVTVERTAHLLVDSALRETRPVPVDGHEGIEATIDGWGRRGGGTGILIERIVGTPGFEVWIDTSGDVADAALVRQVAEQVAASLRIP